MAKAAQSSSILLVLRVFKKRCSRFWELNTRPRKTPCDPYFQHSKSRGRAFSFVFLRKKIQTLGSLYGS